MSAGGREFTIWFEAVVSHRGAIGDGDKIGEALNAKAAIEAVRTQCRLDLMDATWTVDEKEWEEVSSQCSPVSTLYHAEHSLTVESVDEEFLRKLSASGMLAINIEITRKKCQPEGCRDSGFDEQNAGGQVSMGDTNEDDGAKGNDTETNCIVTGLDIMPFLVLDSSRNSFGELHSEIKRRRERLVQSLEHEQQAATEEKLKRIAEVKEKCSQGFETLLSSPAEISKFGGKMKSFVASMSQIYDNAEMDSVFPYGTAQQGGLPSDIVVPTYGKKGANVVVGGVTSISDSQVGHEFFNLGGGIHIARIDFGINLSRPFTFADAHQRLNPFVLTFQRHTLLELSHAEFTFCGQRSCIPWISERTKTGENFTGWNAEGRTRRADPKTASVVWFLSDMEKVNLELFSKKSDDTIEGIQLLTQEDAQNARKSAIAGERYRDSVADELDVKGHLETDPNSLVRALLMSNRIESTPTQKSKVDLAPFMNKREFFHSLADAFQCKRVYGRFIFRTRDGVEMSCGVANFYCPELRTACGPFLCNSPVIPPLGHLSKHYPGMSLDKEIVLSAEARVGYVVSKFKAVTGDIIVNAPGSAVLEGNERTTDKEVDERNTSKEGQSHLVTIAEEGEDDGGGCTKDKVNQKFEGGPIIHSGAERAPEAVFAKLLISIPRHADIQTFLSLISHHNSSALGLSLVQIGAYLLTPEQKMDTVLDILTGFIVFDTYHRLVVVEGRPDFAGMQNLREATLSLHEKVAGCKVRYNSALRYPRRQYADFNLVLKCIKLRKPLEELVTRPELHIAETKLKLGITREINVKKELDRDLLLSASDLAVASVALQQILAIKSQVQCLSQMKAPKPLLPSAHGLHLIELLYGSFVDLNSEIDGSSNLPSGTTTSNIAAAFSSKKIRMVLNALSCEKKGGVETTTEEWLRVRDSRQKRLVTSGNVSDLLNDERNCGSGADNFPLTHNSTKKTSRAPFLETLFTAGRNRRRIVNESSIRNFTENPWADKAALENAWIATDRKLAPRIGNLKQARRVSDGFVFDGVDETAIKALREACHIKTYFGLGEKKDARSDYCRPTLLKSANCKKLLGCITFLQQKPKKKFQSVNAVPKNPFGAVLPL